MNDQSTRATHQTKARFFGLAVCLSTTLVALLSIGCSDGKEGTTGTGGAGGSGGAGGAGGSPVTCLDASTYADLFAIQDEGFCVVALYDADKLGSTPSWGRHGGPMYVEEPTPGGPVSVVRMTPPSGATGKLTATSESYDAALPAMHFLGGQIVDLPFFNWTAISYTLNDLTGEVLLLDGPTIAKRYNTLGFFSAVGLSDGNGGGRLVYSGLSLLGDTATNENAMYAAETCGTAGNMPGLLPAGNMTCKAPLMISSFKDDYSGPVVSDLNGNVFVVLPNASSQSAHGYAADAIKPGSAASAASTLFTMPGFSGSLGAISPDATGMGVLAFQPIDGMSFAALDVVAQRYRINAGSVVADGQPATFLSLTTKGTNLPFFTDDQDRLWVSAAKAQGYAVAVIARRP